MPNYSIKIQDFEGPLDLLMHLIEKDKIDIYDIPIVSITEQYITYLMDMKEFDMDVASEFLLMAATLLQIKSRMLLPKPPAEEEEDSDPRQMLVDMLVEYRKIKLQVKLLAECIQTASHMHSRAPMQFPDLKKKIKPLKLVDLLEALSSIVSVQEPETALIERQKIHVQDKMDDILCLLDQNDYSLEFRSAVNRNGSRSEKIATFLAILELLRLNRITIRQAKPFAPIYIFLQEDETNVL